MEHTENCPFCKGNDNFEIIKRSMSGDLHFMYIKHTCGYSSIRVWCDSLFSKKYEDELYEQHNAVSRAVRESIQFEKNAPRVMKLLRKDKPFVVVANDEPYYIDVFYMIRYNEMIKSRWTEEDEKYYQYSVTHLPTPYKEGE